MASMNMLNPVSWVPEKYLLPAKIVAVLLLGLAAFGWWSAHNRAQQKIGYDRAQVEYREAEAKASAAQRLREQVNFRKSEVALEKRIETEHLLDVARADARAAERRMHDTNANFDRALDGAPAATAIAAARTAGALLDECVTAYRDVADAADGHLADSRQCREAWPE